MEIDAMMKELGKLTMICTPGLLFLGPVLLAYGLDAHLSGVIGGAFLGLGLIGVFYHLKR